MRNTVLVLVGLIAILNQMGSGAKDLPGVIGGGMSLALVATLYGVFFARMVFIPAANKLYQKQETDRFRNLMVVEGLTMLAEKKSPRYMQDRLNSFLEPQNHFDIDKQLRAPTPMQAAAMAAAGQSQPTQPPSKPNA